MAFESVKTQITLLGTVADVTALKAVATAGRVDGDAYLVSSDNVLVAWRPTAELLENLAFGVVLPNDVVLPAAGRWIFLWEVGVGTPAWVNDRLRTRTVADSRLGTVLDYPLGSSAGVIAAWPTADVIYMTTTGATTIHGFDAATATKTDKTIVYRSGAEPLFFADESATELTATNRLDCPPGFAMVEGDTAQLSYDPTSQRWRIG